MRSAFGSVARGIVLATLLGFGSTSADAKLAATDGTAPARAQSGIDLAQIQCRFTGVWIAGDEKICYYICAGTRETRKVKTSDLCPEHITKQ